ncbi:prevent-host-death family protein [Erwinia persicina]|uniref:Antitoxin n=2 Tax=Erwinia TaxID=551 RepID=A0ABV4E742_9GAMM|nr:MULTISPECIES: type II toxin-antitoxin system prevent-host-death family antitoxin [Erwinia]MCP1438783.1 prevent-host-death family protein [Erwinia persicina]MDN4626799.1 type II toxin-antitoxin system prevent-host-death family antitoxin [Erwinia sp. PsM31]MDN8542859.1 type II toxin-antitoxin system prevent-host-death family antitoxin [Erwinia sp. BC051422]
MSVTTMSSRAFNQAVSAARRAAEAGPVYITDRGKPAHVLLTFEDYKRLTGSSRNIQDALAMPEAAEMDFEPERENIVFRDVDFS